MNHSPRVHFLLSRSRVTAAALAATLLAAPLVVAEPAHQPVETSRPQSATAEVILGKVRSAMGYGALAARDRGVLIKGDVTIAALESKGSFLFSPQGEVLWETVGPLSTTVGFDGKTAWERNENGVSRVLALDDRETRLCSIEFLTGAWLADRSHLHFTVAEKSPDGTVALRFTRDGSAAAGTVELDASTYMPTRMVIEGGSEPETVEVSDFKEFNGFKVPGRFSQKQGDNPPSTFTLREVTDAPTFIRNPFEPVLSLPDNFRFDPAAPARIPVRTAPTKHHLVKAMINGQDVGYFIFDSGAGSEVISTKVVEKLGLQAFGKVPVRGVGGMIDAGFYQPDSLNIGPMTIDKPVMVGIDLSFLDQYMGVPVAGVLGYGVLGRSVAVIDAKSEWIELHDSSSYTLPSGEWTEVALYGRHPAVKGEIEGHEGYLRLDTGAANSTITVHAPTVEEFKMLEDRKVQNAMLGGVGGMIEARSGVLKSITLGGRTFENVNATFALPGTGAMNDHGTMGNVGGMLLEPFVLIFDYPHGRMAFIPRPDAPAAGETSVREQ